MLEIFNPGKFILSFYSTEVNHVEKQKSFAITGLHLFPVAWGDKKLCQAPKMEKEGTSDLQQRGAAEHFFVSSSWVQHCLNLSSSPGLGADLCKLCCCSYLGHVAPGSSPGTDNKTHKKEKKKNKKVFRYLFYMQDRQTSKLWLGSVEFCLYELRRIFHEKEWRVAQRLVLQIKGGSWKLPWSGQEAR